MTSAHPLQLQQLQIFWASFPQGLRVCLWDFLTIFPEAHLGGQTLLIPVFMDLDLCTGALSCWNRKGPSPNCFHKVGCMKLSKISWYAETFRVPLTGTKGPSPAPEKQPPTIIPPPPNFTLGTMQSDKYSWQPPNLDSSIRLPDGEA